MYKKEKQSIWRSIMDNLSYNFIRVIGLCLIVGIAYGFVYLLNIFLD